MKTSHDMGAAPVRALLSTMDEEGGEMEDAPTAMGEQDVPSDDSVRHSSSSSSSSSPLVDANEEEEEAAAPPPPPQRNDTNDSGSSGAASLRSGCRRRRRLAFGRVTTHPFDASEPSSMRFDDDATVSEAAADRWEAFFNPAPPSAGGGRRRRDRRADSCAPYSSVSAAGRTSSFQRIEGLVAHEPVGRPRYSRHGGQIRTLLDVLDEVSHMASLTGRLMQQSSASSEAGDVVALPMASIPDAPIPFIPPSHEMDRPGRRRRGIEALLSDPLRPMKDPSIHDKAEACRDPDERPRRTTVHEIRPASSSEVDQVRRRRARNVEVPPPGSTLHGRGTRTAPRRQVGRRGRTLSAFLRGGNPTPYGDGLDEGCTSGILDDAAVSTPLDHVRVVSDRGSTQESESEHGTEEISADTSMDASSRLHFAAPLPWRRVGAKSIEHGTASSDGAESRNRSSMVTNLPSRRFSLAAANPWYRRKDGLQYTHRSPLLARKGSSRRWTLVSILPSRKSQQS